MKINFGDLPLANRFRHKGNQGTKEDLYQLSLVQNDLGLVFIEQPVPFDQMRPRFDWLTETEPVAHLSDVSAMIGRLFRENDQFKVLGVSHRDKVHAELLKSNFGFKEVHYVDYSPYMSEEIFKIETVQHLITHKGELLGEQYGRFDLILANRILHHVHDPIAFLYGISNMLSEDGFIYFEVPDCQRGFLGKD